MSTALYSFICKRLQRSLEVNEKVFRGVATGRITYTYTYSSPASLLVR